MAGTDGNTPNARTEASKPSRLSRELQGELFDVDLRDQRPAKFAASEAPVRVMSPPSVLHVRMPPCDASGLHRSTQSSASNARHRPAVLVPWQHNGPQLHLLLLRETGVTKYATVPGLESSPTARAVLWAAKSDVDALVRLPLTATPSTHYEVPQGLQRVSERIHNMNAIITGTTRLPHVQCNPLPFSESTHDHLARMTMLRGAFVLEVAKDLLNRAGGKATDGQIEVGVGVMQVARCVSPCA